MSNVVRLGRVSSVDYKNGMISVTYPDLDDSVTDNFPVFSFNDEYKMPGIGDNVLVLHLSNGESAGIVMGKYWNESNKPPKTGKKVFRKDLGTSFGEAYIQYDGDNISFHDPGNTSTLGKILSRLDKLESRVSYLESRI